MGARILIIDDNRTSLDLMLNLLRSAGHTAMGAADGLSGLLAALEGDYDLCLCDILIPDIERFELAQRIKADARRSGKPLVAVTALAMADDRGRGLAAGFDGYVDKPVNPQTFIAQVESVLPARLCKDSLRDAKGEVVKILVVDDLAINRKLMTTILKYGGYEVFEAANGAEALEIARRVNPKLMIFDVNMPVMGGRELIERVRLDDTLKNTRLVLYSASLADAEMEAFVKASGVDRTIEKSSDPTHVLQAVQGALRDGATT